MYLCNMPMADRCRSELAVRFSLIGSFPSNFISKMCFLMVPLQFRKEKIADPGSTSFSHIMGKLPHKSSNQNTIYIREQALSAFTMVMTTMPGLGQADIKIGIAQYYFLSFDD